jgi:adenylosuccinate synthase
MGAVVVVGAQWGDEGKGKIVDIYAQYADVVVRYGGGANAGHTLVVDGKKIVLHLVPSGALHKGKRCVIGQGTVVDPAVLIREINQLKDMGLFDEQSFVVSERAFLVLPHHFVIDGLRDGGAGSIGTTKRGIGPAYEDKVARRGLRVGDLLSRETFTRKLEANLAAWRPVIADLGGALPTLESIVEPYLAFGRELAPLIGDAACSVRDALVSGKRILMEGAQGTLLDIDTGTYPFVTSSSTVSGGACIGAGIGPTHISAVVGITKAYATRVGNGPFPTEMLGEDGNALREAGGEFGATTGRPRRCGWLDLPALRYAVQVNGLSGLAITKLDVLTGMESIQVCTGYKLGDKLLSLPPYDGLEKVTPIYQTVPGWKEPLGKCRRVEELPREVRDYVKLIEDAVGCPAWLLSVGADREQTIVVRNPYDGV